MPAAELRALSPLVALGAAAVVVALLAAFRRSHAIAAATTLLGVGVAFACLGLAAATAPQRVGPLLLVDHYALLFTGLLLGAALVVTLLARGYLETRVEAPEEFYPLLLLATLGGAVLVSTSHLLGLFLGLELLSVPLYVLIAYPLGSARALEAGMKYLVLAGSSSAFLLFGTALVYAQTGSLDFAAVVERVGEPASGLLIGGLALILAGLGFKLAVVPFHMWTPDVYQGAPAPVTAFLATASKGAVLALLARLLAPLPSVDGLWGVLAAIAVASMLVGNLLALVQQNVKRILAYSSIAHLGYMLVALLAGGGEGLEALGYYLAAYFVTTLGAFGVVGMLSGPEGEAEELDEYRGLLWHRPWLAGFFAATLFSLAGIPLTAGFIGKFYVFSAAVASARWLLGVAIALTSTIGLFYYLRIIVVMFTHSAQPQADAGEGRLRLSAGAGVALVLLALLLLGLGVYPSPLVRLLHAAVGLA